MPNSTRKIGVKEGANGTAPDFSVQKCRETGGGQVNEMGGARGGGGGIARGISASEVGNHNPLEGEERNLYEKDGQSVEEPVGGGEKGRHPVARIGGEEKGWRRKAGLLETSIKHPVLTIRGRWGGEARRHLLRKKPIRKRGDGKLYRRKSHTPYGLST